MSKKDIRKKYKGRWTTGKWLKRYFEKRTTKRKHEEKIEIDLNEFKKLHEELLNHQYTPPVEFTELMNFKYLAQ